MTEPQATLTIGRSIAFATWLVALSACSGDSTGPVTSDRSPFSGQDGRYTVSSFESGTRGKVEFTVYLPPGWSPDGAETYPVIFFLHGQGGDQYSFTRGVSASELNRWIEAELLPPFVVVAPRGAVDTDTVQWYYPGNVAMLTSEASDELRAFSLKTFRAGGDPNRTSVHGHSRGATGAIFYALNHWSRFASAVGNAFVSDYVLDQLRDDATRNRDAIVASGIPLRFVIGSEDRFSIELGRVGSPLMHQHLESLGIPHEYEFMPGVTHGLSSIWNYEGEDEQENGLYELQFHAAAWGG